MKSIIKMLMALMLFVLVIAGCEYDTNSVVYEDKITYPEGPSITGIDPDQVAIPGANTISILGTNFCNGAENNQVYFNNNPVEVLEASSTIIKVRRPNIISDSVIIRVVAFDNYLVAEYDQPYKIEPVSADVGAFIENKELSALAVDKNENLYVCERVARVVWKISSTGDKTQFAQTSRFVTDAKIGPGGMLMLMANNKNIYQINLATGEETVWKTAAKSVSYGDFDSQGNFFTGAKNNLYVLLANGGSLDIDLNKFNFRCVRVYNGYVYLLAENTSPDEENPELGIWRFEIKSDGSLGEKELFLDWAETGDYAESDPTFLTFGQDGIMYVTTDNENPIFMLDEDGKQDVLYKEILTSPLTYITWGSQNDMYVIIGGDENKVNSIGMGAQCAPYYGRDL